MLDQLLLGDAAAQRQALERIEVHHDQVDGLDAARSRRSAVSVGVVAPRQDRAVDRRVQRLDAPPSISGAPVTSSTERDLEAGLLQPAAVPAEATSSTPRAVRPLAKGTSPVLSDTDRSALPDLLHAPSTGADRHLASLHPDTVPRKRQHGVDQEPVLDRPEALAQRLRLVIVEDWNRLLQEDGAGVQALVDEMDGHARDPHAVAQGVADAVEAGEGRQQRRVDVDRRQPAPAARASAAP